MPFNAVSQAREEKTAGGAADFEGKLVVGARRLAYTQTLRMKKRVYEAEDWKDVRDALRGYEKFSKSAVIIKKQ